MEIYVGTSGFSYDWNPNGFEWYVTHSGLNALELNTTFYRFPFPSAVKAWADKGKNLKWIIKVTRWVTHYFRFNPRALVTWNKFFDLFKPLDKSIDI